MNFKLLLIKIYLRKYILYKYILYILYSLYILYKYITITYINIIKKYIFINLNSKKMQWLPLSFKIYVQASNQHILLLYPLINIGLHRS